MSVLDPPRHPVVIRALDHARWWCEGHIIDGAPAFTHAVLVARTLVDHLPDRSAHLVAAALLHDSTEFAPPGIHLEKTLDTEIGRGVFRLVTALYAEHQAMAPDHEPDVSNPEVLVLAAADRIVAFKSLLTRARRSHDLPAFFAARTPLLELIPYFHRWMQQASPHLPDSLMVEQRLSLDELCSAIDGETGY